MASSGDATGWILLGLWTLATWLITRWLLRRLERWYMAGAEARRREGERIEDALDQRRRQDGLAIVAREPPGEMDRPG